jgi:hypothetical protein
MMRGQGAAVRVQAFYISVVVLHAHPAKVPTLQLGALAREYRKISSPRLYLHQFPANAHPQYIPPKFQFFMERIKGRVLFIFCEQEEALDKQAF